MIGDSDQLLSGMGSEERRSTGRTVPVDGIPDPPAMNRWWLLIAPIVMGGVYLTLVVAFGEELLRTGRPWPHGFLATVLLVAFFLVCLGGTVRLYDDTIALRQADADWQPNPWHYLVGGGLVLMTYRGAQLTLLERSVSNMVPYLAGSFVVALVLSSLVAGPVYLVVRRWKGVQK